MEEQKLKTILEDQRKQYENYLGVVVERIESQTKLIAESILGVQEQLIAVRDMVAKNTENIEIMKVDIQFIKQGLKKKADQDEFENLEKRVMLLEKKLT